MEKKKGNIGHMINQLSTYLRQKASTAVSVFVLFGCVAITVLLVYSTMQAHLLGEKFTSSAYNIEDY